MDGLLLSNKFPGNPAFSLIAALVCQGRGRRMTLAEEGRREEFLSVLLESLKTFLAQLPQHKLPSGNRHSPPRHRLQRPVRVVAGIKRRPEFDDAASIFLSAKRPLYRTAKAQTIVQQREDNYFTRQTLKIDDPFNSSFMDDEFVEVDLGMLLSGGVCSCAQLVPVMRRIENEPMFAHICRRSIEATLGEIQKSDSQALRLQAFADIYRLSIRLKSDCHDISTLIEPIGETILRLYESTLMVFKTSSKGLANIWLQLALRMSRSVAILFSDGFQLSDQIVSIGSIYLKSFE